MQRVRSVFAYLCCTAVCGGCVLLGALASAAPGDLHGNVTPYVTDMTVDDSGLPPDDLALPDDPPVDIDMTQISGDDMTQTGGSTGDDLATGTTGGGTCTDQLTAALVDTPPAGAAPLDVQFDTTGSELNCNQTTPVANYVLFASNGDVVPLDPNTLAQTAKLTMEIPGFYNAQSYLVEQDGKFAFSPPAVMAVGNSITGRMPPTVEISAKNMGDPLTYDFTEVTQSTGKIIERRWSFGDGGQDDRTEVVHAYPRPGIYRVDLVETDDSGMAAFARGFVAISDSNGNAAASILVGLMPAEAPPAQPILLTAFIDNVRGAQIAAASVAWPDGSIDQQPLVTPANTGFVLTSQHVLSDPGEADVPVSVTLDDGRQLSSSAHVLVTNPDGSQPSPVVLSQPYNKGVVGQEYELNGPGATSRGLMVRGNGPFTFTVAQPSPANLEIDGAGNFSWKPTTDGNERITVDIGDAAKVHKLFSFVVNVAPRSGASGCGCSLAPTPAPTPLLALLGIALTAHLVRRRRRA